MLQAVLFNKSIYDTTYARRWLRRHNITALKRVHETTNWLRYRINQPDYDRFEYKTKNFGNGIKAVIGYPAYEMY